MRSAPALVVLVLAACGDDGGGAPVDAAADGAVDAASDAATDAAIVGGGGVGSPDCAPGGSHGPDHVGSGSRLRARFHVAAGGARSFDAFHDDVLDLDCRFEQPDEGTGTSGCRPVGWPPIPIGMFATAKACVDPEATRVHGTRLVGEDGSSSPLGMRDVMEQEVCIPQLFDGTWRCMVPWMTSSAFADDHCTDQIGITSGPSPTHASYAVDDDRRIRTVTGLVGIIPIFRVRLGMCELIHAPGVAAYALGPQVPASAFAEVTGSARDSGQRIRPFAMSSGDFERDTGGLFDTQLGLACRPFVDLDGSTRCAPDPGYVVEHYFADAACTSPIDLMRSLDLVYGFPIGFPREEVAGTPLGGPPSTGAPYWPRGALHNGPVYLRFPPQPCFAATPGTPLYRLGARIELADLAVLTPQFQ